MKEKLPSSSFNSPEFKEILAKYEQMVSNQLSVYFENEDLILISEYYAEKGRIEDSYGALQFARKLYPDNIDIHIYICNNLLAQKKFREVYDILCSLPDQNDVEVLFLYATFYLDLKEPDTAEEYFNKIAGQTDDVDTLLDIVDLYMDAEKADYAWKWLGKIQNKYPDNTEVLETLAEYHSIYGDIQQAIDCTNRLIDLEPYQKIYWMNLSRCYLQLEQPAKALDAIDYALAIAEDDAVALELKGFCYMQMGNTDEACACLKKVEQNSPHRLQLLQMISECYLSRQDYSTAIEYLTKALDIKKIPDYERAGLLQKRALLYLFCDKMELCRQDLEKGMEYDRENPLLHISMGEYYTKQQLREKAIMEYEYAFDLAIDRGHTIAEAAISCLRQNMVDDAIRYFERLEKEYPELVKPYYGCMAYCYFLCYMPRKTFRAMVKAICYAPESVQDVENIISTDHSKDIDQFLKATDKLKNSIENGVINPNDYLETNIGDLPPE